MRIQEVYIITVGTRSECILKSYNANKLCPKVVIRRNGQTEEIYLNIFFEEVKNGSISIEELVYIKELACKENCLSFLKTTFNLNLHSIVRPRDYELTDGHIGSMLGHRTVWEHIQNKNEGFYMICEDDWVPPDNLQAKLSELTNVCDVDIIYLFHCDRLIKSQQVIFQYCDIHKSWGIPNPTFGLQAYILTKKGAKKLLDNCTNKNEEAIMWLCDDLTGLSIQTSNWNNILNQKHQSEADYMKFVYAYQSNFQSFDNWQLLNAYGFRRNIGKLLDVTSSTESWDYALHNRVVQYLKVGKYK